MSMRDIADQIGAITVDDLARTPPQRCHPRRQARVPHISGAMEADLAARRPKVAKLVEHEPLREYVQEVPSGVIRDENGEVVGPFASWKGRNKARRADRRWASA